MAAIDPLDPRDSTYGRDYWLHRCEGFTVQRAQRALGKVTGLRFRDSIEPEHLEVRTGRFGKRLLIPVEQVQQIDPKTRRIVLGTASVAPPLDDALKPRTPSAQ
jgi:hypothetical protein